MAEEPRVDPPREDLRIVQGRTWAHELPVRFLGLVQDVLAMGEEGVGALTPGYYFIGYRSAWRLKGQIRAAPTDSAELLHEWSEELENMTVKDDGTVMLHVPGAVSELWHGDWRNASYDVIGITGEDDPAKVSIAKLVQGHVDLIRGRVTVP